MSAVANHGYLGMAGFPPLRIGHPSQVVIRGTASLAFNHILPAFNLHTDDDDDDDEEEILTSIPHWGWGFVCGNTTVQENTELHKVGDFTTGLFIVFPRCGNTHT